jgi:hypothetical protein
MQKIIEFIILVVCIAIACGIITWAVRSDNKQPKDQKKKGE